MLTDVMHVVSFLGSAAFYLPVLAVVFWCVSPRSGARAIVLLTLSAALNTLLKLSLREPRPFWTDPSVVGQEGRSSFGMPSGHAQNATVMWGLAATLTRRRWVRAGAVVMIVLIGVSRVQLGVHSVTQVVAGWAIGSVLLIVAVRLAPVVLPWWRERGLTAHVALSLTVTAAFLLPTIWAIDAHAGQVFPTAWAAQIRAAGGTLQPVTIADATAAAGAVFGVLLGISVLDRRGWFEVGGTWPRRLARIPVGAAGAGMIAGAGSLVAGNPEAAFTVQALVALWAVAGAPEAFVRLGLAGRTTPQIPLAGENSLAPHP